MPLRITILDGPGAGEAFEFDDTMDFIEIGRDPDHCGVVFPADLTKVGRRHLGIRRSLGGYELEVKAQNPVLIDGREPFDGEALGPVQEIRLGRDGPRLRIETSVESALPATELTTPMESESRKAQRLSRATRRIAAAVVVVAVVLATGWAGLYWQQVRSDRQLTEIATGLQALEESVDQLAPETLERVARSTYAVLVRDEFGGEQPFGTAWVVGDGVLATNAHVAEVFSELEPRQSLAVRATTPPHATVPIERVLVHPDYERFSERWEAEGPTRMSVAGPEEVDVPGAGYDVALMYAEEGHDLEPPLELADDAGLAGLAPGRAIGFVGFPTELLVSGGFNLRAPVPQVQVGHVTAVTDYFLLPRDGPERTLIQHSLPGTGGASGSPVVDAGGRVVGLISGMNFIFLSHLRVPSAAGVNFAQSSALVRELLEDRTEDVAEARLAAWADGFATFDDPAELIPRSFYRRWIERFDEAVEPMEFARETGTLRYSEDQGLFATTFRSLITEPGSYFAIAISRERHDIDMAAISDGELLDRDEALDWYPLLVFEHDGGAAIDLVIYAYGSEQPDYELAVWRIPPQVGAE